MPESEFNIIIFLKNAQKIGETIKTEFLHVHPSAVYSHTANDKIVQQNLIRFPARSYSSRSDTHLCFAQVFLSKGA